MVISTLKSSVVNNFPPLGPALNSDWVLPSFVVDPSLDWEVEGVASGELEEDLLPPKSINPPNTTPIEIAIIIFLS